MAFPFPTVGSDTHIHNIDASDRSPMIGQLDAETTHRTALAQLNGEFAEIVRAEDVLDAVTVGSGA